MIMRNTICFVASLLFAVFAQAQVDVVGLQKFTNELKALSSEHVECISENFNPYAKLDFPDNLVVFKMRDQSSLYNQNSAITGITTADTTFRFVHVISEDAAGYQLVHAVLDKYYDIESEDIFGIPLMTCKREDGEEQILFMEAHNTLLIRDDGDEIEILYASLNLMNTIQNQLRMVADVFNEGYIDVEVFGGMDFSVHVANGDEFRNEPNPYQPTAKIEDILVLANKIYNDNAAMLQSELNNAGSDEEREEIEKMIASLKEGHNEKLHEMESELNELEGPSFIEIAPGSDEHYVVIPNVPAHLADNMKPYAASGVYDWINSYYCFRSGAKMGYTDIISCIVTPRDVAMQYAFKNYPRNKWYDDGYSKEYKELAAVEYQGSTPALLYSFSQTPNGYANMIHEFDHLFKLELGDKMHGLEVTQHSELNGKRFVQLWGEGNILMCLYDDPVKKYCHMSIIVGGITGFEQAVNEYNFGGKKDFAKMCNIVIDSDLGDNSYGIHFITDEYFYAGKSHKNGVHIDFGYAKKLTE